ncbi:hypothetical protein J6590_023108 [Homalodisca vitripennis]|nr:hypothetical protein J6590_023108 [Homalodisca vitripennis]
MVARVNFPSADFLDSTVHNTRRDQLRSRYRRWRRSLQPAQAQTPGLVKPVPVPSDSAHSGNIPTDAQRDRDNSPFGRCRENVDLACAPLYHFGSSLTVCSTQLGSLLAGL